MLPPFPAVDYCIHSALPWEERRPTRRSTPERLRFEPPGPSLLAHPIAPAPAPLRPSRLRLRLARALVGMGRRLAGPDAVL